MIPHSQGTRNDLSRVLRPASIDLTLDQRGLLIVQFDLHSATIRSPETSGHPLTSHIAGRTSAIEHPDHALLDKSADRLARNWESGGPTGSPVSRRR